MIAHDALVVQLVAFSNTSTQLPRYLDTLREAGYEEVGLKGDNANEYYVRNVPQRKWYTNGKMEKQPEKCYWYTGWGVRALYTAHGLWVL